MEHTTPSGATKELTRGQKIGRFLLRALGRLLLVIFTVAVLAVVGLAVVCNHIFNVYCTTWIR